MGGASIAFTYAASDTSGRVRNPFVAVWVEDSTSKMVGLVSVLFSARDAQYLRELTEYSAVASGANAAEIDAVTGATRSAGQFQLHWVGKGLDGSVLSGNYNVWIEAAREHGPHSVMNGAVTLGKAGSATIIGNGELSNAVVTIG